MPSQVQQPPKARARYLASCDRYAADKKKPTHGDSLLSLAIKQITAPNWRNDPTAPWKTNRKRLNESAEKREQLFKSISRKRNPVTMFQLAMEHDCAIAKIRSMAEPYVRSGMLIRGQNDDGKVTLSKAR